jgi:signal transduction histidine kinase
VKELIEIRTEQIGEARDHLKGNVFVINLIVFAIGGGLAYLLAKRNLAPIEEAHEAQTRFTADASHELRTPLAAMRSEIEVVLRDRALTLGAAKKQLQSNLEEIAKLEALSDGLLKLARQEHNLEQYEEVALAEVVQKVVQSMAARAEAQTMTLVTEISDVRVRGDSWSLMELMAILLDNAIKYSPPKTVATIRLRRLGGRAELTIHDQGQGIKASDLPHIFDRFYRADQARSKEKVSGYGLGLAIAKQIVEAHQGSMTIRSTPGVETVVTVLLPVASKL